VSRWSLLAALAAVAVCAAALLSPLLAGAANCTTSWVTNKSGPWNSSTFWTNGVPTATCDAVINVPGTYTVTITGSATAQGLTLGPATGGTGTQTLRVQEAAWPSPARRSVPAR
jgi:hypothetical protein